MNQQLSYEQISEILRTIKDAHERVRNFCTEHEFDFEDDRKQLLIAALRGDQKRIEDALENFDQSPINQSAAETWIQYVPQQELDASLERIFELESPPFDDLVAAVGNFYLVIATFIERIRSQAPSEKASEFLESLELLETQIGKALTNRIAGLRDT